MKTGRLEAFSDSVFGFCGIKCTSTFFGNVATGTDEMRKDYLASIK